MVNIPYNTFIPDCFTDCFNPGQPYSGIRSSTKSGESCNELNKIEFKSGKSNICNVSSIISWCNETNGGQYCDVPQCSAIDYGSKSFKNI